MMPRAPLVSRTLVRNMNLLTSLLTLSSPFLFFLLTCHFYLWIPFVLKHLISLVIPTFSLPIHYIVKHITHLSLSVFCIALVTPFFSFLCSHDPPINSRIISQVISLHRWPPASLVYYPYSVLHGTYTVGTGSPRGLAGPWPSAIIMAADVKHPLLYHHLPQ